MSTQGQGTVKWYNPEKAYGFITTAAGDDLFVHRNGLADGRPWLIDGQGVAFTIKQGMKGSEAADVRVVRDVEEIPAFRQRLYDGAPRGSGERRAYANRGGDYGYRAEGGFRAASRRAPYSGPIPHGPVAATVMRVDPSGRFLFAHTEAIGEDVYVHNSLFAGRHPQPGDAIAITIENGERGLRARTLADR